MSENSAPTGTTVTYDPVMETKTSKALTAHDRCDRCGAQAVCRAELEALDLELLFCGHHTTEQREGLETKGWRLSLVAA